MTERRPLLRSVYDAVAERTSLADATVDRVTLGDRLVVVEVGDGGRAREAGVSHRPAGDLDEEPTGERVLDVAGWVIDETRPDPLRRAVGVAALNALSATLVEWRTGDPFEALSPTVSAIATVGLFGPAFRKFGAVEVRVIERREVEPPATPEGVSVAFFGPDDAERAIDGADAVFVTGSSLLYGGTERYLAAARGVPAVVLVGATASFVPEPAFEAGATMLAGARVTDVEAVRRGAAAGECATDLHDVGLEKVYVTAGEPEGLEFG